MDQVTTQAAIKESTYREAVREALRDALRRDERVFLMGEDVGRYGGCYAVSHGLLAEFGPERIRDTPLSESGFTGAGIGIVAAFGLFAGIDCIAALHPPAVLRVNAVFRRIERLVRRLFLRFEVTEREAGFAFVLSLDRLCRNPIGAPSLCLYYPSGGHTR